MIGGWVPYLSLLAAAEEVLELVRELRLGEPEARGLLRFQTR